jgi:SAM-dependent methyltransferase
MQDPQHIRRAYDSVAAEYARRFSGELAHKPLDREILRRFADGVRPGGTVYDLGCGPGQTTAFLHSLGVPVRGLDLSPGLLEHARRLNPEIPFDEGDMLALPYPDRSAAGVLAFYSIVHFSLPELQAALAGMHRVLEPGGRLLLAFHVGEERVHVEELLGEPVSLDFSFFMPDAVRSGLIEAGFAEVETVTREPYPDVEYPSRRAYLLARKETSAHE